MEYKAKLKQVKLSQTEDGQDLIILLFTAEDGKRLISWFSSKNRPCPNAWLKAMAKALSGGNLILIGSIIWQGTPQEIEDFFKQKIGKECMVKARPYYGDVLLITNVRACNANG